MQTTVALRILHFGHEAPGGHAMNVRSAGQRLVGIEELAANIDAVGLLQPLHVREVDEVLYVADGNRRLAALRRLYGVDSDCAVPVFWGTSTVSGHEVSLSANIERLPLHPIDQYEAFAALADLTPAAIAARYGIKERQVRQQLALGALSPRVREAWRDERIDARAAQAFTLVPGDHATQDQVLDQLLAEKINHWGLREALGAADVETGKLLAFVGVEAYRAAGGSAVEDLFGSTPVVSDAPLLKRLSGEKLEAECLRLVEEGWAWAQTQHSMPAAWFSWATSELQFTAKEKARLEEITQAIERADVDWDQEQGLEEERDRIEAQAELRGYSDRQKAKSGCVLSVGIDGTLEITYGVIRPGTAAAPERTKDKDPGALALRLSEQLTIAAAAALEQDPDLGAEGLRAARDQGGARARGGAQGGRQVQAGARPDRTRQRRPAAHLAAAGAAHGPVRRRTTDDGRRRAEEEGCGAGGEGNQTNRQTWRTRREEGRMTAPVTLRDMITEAQIEAARLEVTEAAMVNAGFRQEWDAGQLRKRDVFDAIARLLERIAADPALVRRLKDKRD
jgi:ParB family chromosome partitioning protein